MTRKIKSFPHSFANTFSTTSPSRASLNDCLHSLFSLSLSLSLSLLSLSSLSLLSLSLSLYIYIYIYILPSLLYTSYLFSRLGSVGLVVSELRTIDGEEQRLDSRMLQVFLGLSYSVIPHASSKFILLFPTLHFSSYDSTFISFIHNLTNLYYLPFYFSSFSLSLYLTLSVSERRGFRVRYLGRDGSTRCRRREGECRY